VGRPLKALASKFALDVDAQPFRSGSVGQGHRQITIEQPASRHSKPASLKISQGFFSACAARRHPTRNDHGTHAFLESSVPLQTARQRAGLDAAVVQGPVNTVSSRCRSTPCLRSGPCIQSRVFAGRLPPVKSDCGGTLACRAERPRRSATRLRLARCSFALDGDDLGPNRVVIGVNAFPLSPTQLPTGHLGRGAPWHIERLVIGADQACARAALDGHGSDVMRPFHRQITIRLFAQFDKHSRCHPPCRFHRITVMVTSLAASHRWQLPGDSTFIVLDFFLDQPFGVASRVRPLKVPIPWPASRTPPCVACGVAASTVMPGGPPLSGQR